MDHQYDQQKHANSGQQGNSYQQGNAYQQGNPYQQGNLYQQGNAYQQGNMYQQGNAYQQGNMYQQGNSYQQGNTYQQGNPYQQGNAYQQGNSYQQGNPYQQANSYTNYDYNNYGGSSHYGDTLEQQKAPNIFQQFALSFIPSQYGRLVKVSTGSMIGFVTLLALIATVISFISLLGIFAPGEVETWANMMPDFEIRDGRLFVEEDFMYDEGGVLVYLTEDVEAFTYEDASELIEEGYQEVMLAGRDRISIMQRGEYQQVDFADLGSELEISRDWIVDTFVPLLMLMLVVGYVIFFVGRVLWYFLCAAVYLLIAMLIASIMKKQLPAGALFRVAVYAKVLMFVAATVLSIVPFVNLSVPFMLRVVITVAFMAFAIVKLPERN